MKFQTFEIDSPERTYLVLEELPEGQIYSRLCRATTDVDGKKRDVLLKMTLDEVHAKNEADTLRHLNTRISDGSRALQMVIPELIEEFDYNGLRVVVTDFAVGYWTIEQIHNEYPEGIPAPHMAWIFNRMMKALMVCHPEGVVHGQLLPCNFLIRSGDEHDPLRHTAVLIDWTGSVRSVEHNKWPRLAFMDEGYSQYYPGEVLRREPASPSLDLAMAAGCAILLLGGDVETMEMPKNVPWAIAQLLRTCRSPNIAMRPRDLPTFFVEFQRTLAQFFGEPKFVELPLPRRA